MSHHVPAVIRGGLPDPERPIRLARLENKITELAAHINAATFQLLILIREYDEQEGWGRHGVASCAIGCNGSAAPTLEPPARKSGSPLSREP